MDNAKITKLKKEIEKEEERVLNEKENKLKKEVNSLVGKCAKYPNRSETSVYITYVRIIGVASDGRLLTEEVHISYSAVGWIVNSGNLRYMGSNGRAYRPATKEMGKWNNSYGPNASGRDYHTSQEFGGLTDKGVRLNNNCYFYCDEKEFFRAQELSITHNESFRRDFEPLIKTGAVPYLDEEVTLLNHDNVKTLNSLLQKNGIDSVFLKKMVKSLNSLQDFVQYNAKGQIEEMVQYEIHSKQNAISGIDLTVMGGDGGTDYEPYVTNYYIDNVVIDWKRVLYNIRHKLKCSVSEMAKKLEKINRTYDPVNWCCTYSGDYDVTFEEARLTALSLKIINNEIKKELL